MELKSLIKSFISEKGEPPVTDFEGDVEPTGEILIQQGFEDWLFTSTRFQDADKTCFALAEKFKAFAILSGDSDFLIFQYSQAITFLTVKDLNLDTLDTTALSQNALVEYLDRTSFARDSFEKKHLPLFATLMGNDIFCFDMVKHFHQMLTCKYF